MIRTGFLLGALWIGALSLYGQQNKYDEISPEGEWEEGEILLENGDVLNGLLRYNDRNGVLSYESGNISRSFTARTVTGFQLFDHVLNRQRLYYSLEHTEGKKGQKRPYFFEVLRDFGAFAVVSKADPIVIKEYANGGSFSPGSMTVGVSGITTVVKQQETVYFLNSNGVLEEYIKIVRTVRDSYMFGFDHESTRHKVVDKTLLKKYFQEPGLSEMIQYANDNELEFEVREDLAKILSLYRSEETK